MMLTKSSVLGVYVSGTGSRFELDQLWVLILKNWKLKVHGCEEPSLELDCRFYQIKRLRWDPNGN